MRLATRHNKSHAYRGYALASHTSLKAVSALERSFFFFNANKSRWRRRYSARLATVASSIAAFPDLPLPPLLVALLASSESRVERNCGKKGGGKHRHMGGQTDVGEFEAWGGARSEMQQIECAPYLTIALLAGGESLLSSRSLGCVHCQQ